MNAKDMHPKLAMDSVVRGVAALQERALQRAGLDLTTQQATVAVVLLELGEQPVQELAARLEIGQAAMTRLVDRLQTKQLVVRSQSALDGRVVNVSLTAAGTPVAMAARHVIDELKAILLADIEASDLEVFWRALRQMHTTVANYLSSEPE